MDVEAGTHLPVCIGQCSAPLQGDGALLLGVHPAPPAHGCLAYIPRRGLRLAVPQHAQTAGAPGQLLKNLPAAASATEERSRVENLAISGSYTGIKTLQRRAQGFAGKLYRKNLTLSESVGVSMPIFGLFDIVVTLSASVDALLSTRIEV